MQASTCTPRTHSQVRDAERQEVIDAVCLAYKTRRSVYCPRTEVYANPDGSCTMTPTAPVHHE